LGREEICTKFWLESVPLGRPRLTEHGRVILKWILAKLGGREWSNEPLSFINGNKFIDELSDY
jgi:hypothetical protein